jgi:PAS domain S-box-containing protein
MGELIRRHDWAATPLGAPGTWPEPLRAALSICLHSSFPSAIYWGEDLRLLYNDAWAPIPAERHPWALGRPGAEVWPEIWDLVGPQFEAVIRTGAGFSTYEQFLPMIRNGRQQETYWNYSFTPIRDRAGSVLGILNQGNEVTDRVVGDRRRQFLLGLSDRLRGLKEARAAIDASQEALGLFLHAGRVGYGEVDASERWFTTANNWTDGQMPSRHGTHDLAAFGEPIWSALRSGTPLVVNDVWEDERTNSAESLAAFEAIDTRAAMTVSLVKESHMRAALYVHAAAPRLWSDADVQLVADVAERTWTAVERIRAEEALKASEARLRALNETLADQVAERTADRDRMWRLSTDIMLVARIDATICAVNPAWTRLLGWAEDELIGTSFMALIHPEDAAVTASEAERLGSGATTHKFENRYRAKDGNYRWLSWTAVPEAGLIHAVGRDISAEKRATEELEKAQEALRQSQ